MLPSEFPVAPFLDTLEDMFFVLDLHGHIVHTNISLQTHLGYTNAELDGRHISYLYHPDQHHLVTQALNTALDGIAASYCLPMITKQGFPLLSETSINDSSWNHGTVMVGISREVKLLAPVETRMSHPKTEQRHHLEPNVQHENVLSIMLHSMVDGVMLVDTNGTILASNQAAACLFGYTPDTLAGCSWVELCLHLDPFFPVQQVTATINDGTMHTYRLSYAEVSGKNRVFHIHTLPLFEKHRTGSKTNGHTQTHSLKHDTAPGYGMIVQLVDVTEQCYTQARMLQHERFTSGNRIAATVAHELNTPLQNIQGLLHLIGDARKRERDQYVQQAIADVDRIGSLLHRLSETYQSAFSSSVVSAPIDINNLLKRILLLFNRTRIKQKVTISLDFAPNLPLFYGCINHLVQVLFTCILHAFNAMPTGGVLCLCTYHKNGTLTESLADAEHPEPAVAAQDTVQPPFLVIEIADNGCGITPTLHSDVLEPLCTTRSTEWSGFEFGVLQNMIVSYGGTIDVSNVPGVGTTVTIELPARPPQ